jgi:hypothetical protein
MGSRGRDCMVVGFTISVQSVPITTNVVSSNLLHGEVFSIQHYVIKIVSELQQVGCFLWVLRFPPPIKSITTKKWNVVESDDKHHKPNQAYCLHCFPRIRWNISTTMSFGEWYTIKCPQIGKSQMFLKKWNLHAYRSLCRFQGIYNAKTIKINAIFKYSSTLYYKMHSETVKTC